MEMDEDEVPTLVNVGEVMNKRALSPTSSQLRDLSLARVPLTIVTGVSPASFDQTVLLIGYHRIFGCRQNHNGELYPQGAAWEEDSSYIERLVYTMSSLFQPIHC